MKKKSKTLGRTVQYDPSLESREFGTGKEKDIWTRLGVPACKSYTQTIPQTFEQIQKENFELFKKKHHDYGPDNIRSLGERGAFVRMWDKVNRLKTLCWDKQEKNQVEDESIDDTLRDIANYAIIWMLIRQGKW